MHFARTVIITVTLVMVAMISTASAGQLEQAFELYDKNEYAKALPLLKAEAKKGNAKAMRYLGVIYGNGYEVKADLDKALKYFRNSAELGHAPAMYNMGQAYLKGLGIKKDDAKALEWFRKAADKGNRYAFNDLGFMYKSGRGVEKDYAKAMEWFKKAADKNIASAMKNIGDLYKYGMGVDRNPAMMLKWYKKAAEAGGPKYELIIGREYNYGHYLKKDCAKAIEWYTKAADKNHIPAMNELAGAYLTGNCVEKSKTKAFEIFTRMAELGDGRAQELLGHEYVKGEVVKQDYAKAEKWFKKAAANGRKGAKAALAQLPKDITATKDEFALFGAAITRANRASMRNVLNKKKLPHIRVKDGYWADSYNPSGVLEGAQRLDIYYTQEGHFARAVYTIPARMNPQKVVEIKDMVSRKYGPPSVSEGNPNVGQASYLWDTKGVKIVISRGWPDTTVFLGFMVPKYSDQFNAQLKKQQEQAKARKAKKQADAF